MINKKASEAVKIIFTLFIMILLVIVFYAFLVQMLEGGPEFTALNAVRDSVEEVCRERGDYKIIVNIYIPNSNGRTVKHNVKYYGIEINSDRTVRLTYNDYYQDSGGDREDNGKTIDGTIKKKKLDCPAGVKITTYRFEPKEGKESIDLTIKKENNEVTFSHAVTVLPTS